jgi:hypothetical protein
MGNTFEVYTYVSIGEGEYDYKLLYAGEDAAEALRHLLSTPGSCFKLEYRPMNKES